MKKVSMTVLVSFLRMASPSGHEGVVDLTPFDSNFVIA